MDDISAFIKSSFLNLQKRSIGKNYQQKTLKDRMNNFNNVRRETRNTLIFKKRQINENMTPINTPEPSKVVKKAVEKKEEKKSSRRLEMLHKWKAEKEIQKQEEKRKAKPLFKVYHVPVEMGLPKLDNVNKEIKGKPISQFAPPNHKFHAPKNVQPINFRDKNNSLLGKSKIGLQRINSSETSKPTPRQKLRVPQKNMKSSTHKKEVVEQQKQITPQIPKVNPRSATAKKPVSVNSKSVAQQTTDHSRQPNDFKENTLNSRKKPEPKSKLVAKAKGNISGKSSPPKKSRKNNVKIDVNSEVLESVIRTSSLDKAENNIVTKTPKRKLRMEQIRGVKEDLKNGAELKENSRTLRNSRSAKVAPKKSVGWDVIEIVDSDNEIFPKNINSSTPKKTPKKYNKTPKRNKEPETVGDIDSKKTTRNEDDEEVERNSQSTPKNNKKPDDTSVIHISPVVTVATTPANIVKRMTKGKMLTKQIRDVEVKNQEELQENSNKIANVIDNLKNQEELKENSAKTPRKSRKSVGVAPQKNVDWNVIEIIHSDDESFAKNITSTTPNKTPKKYNKTPKMTKEPETVTKVNDDEAEVDKNPLTTPKNNKKVDDTSPVYISPFVTICRGKTSAKKEYQVRHSGSTSDFNKSISDSTSPKAGAEYFTMKLNNEITRIEGVCDTWNKYRDENTVPEEANDLIDVAIGQSKLLISKKFQQFRNLIEQCRNNEYLEKPISCEDLHGFWDMIFMQVEDLDKRFKNLDDLKANNWEEVIPAKKPVLKRGRGRPKKASATSSLKDIIKAARKSKKANEEENEIIVPQPDEVKLFSGGYYLIKSPVKEEKISAQHPSSARRSLRVSLLTSQVKKRYSSPGLMMMKVSQAIKQGDGLTPSRSILKNDLTKSGSRKAKSVLFKDDLVKDIDRQLNSLKINGECYTDKENDASEINLITFSPQTPVRRSQRLSRIK